MMFSNPGGDVSSCLHFYYSEQQKICRFEGSTHNVSWQYINKIVNEYINGRFLNLVRGQRLHLIKAVV